MQATDTAVGGGSRPGVPRQAIDIKRRTNGDQHMPRFLIERDLPGAGALSPGDLQGIARKSCDVLHDLGPDIQWVHSYVTKDKITCIYLAPNADIIREHAKRGGFPATRVEEVVAVIDPETANSGDRSVRAARL
jgi:hypothetical protein